MPQETVEQAFIERCRAISRQLLPALLAEHRGNMIAIEPESGDDVLGENLDSALVNALAQYPHRRFGFFQVDESPAVVKLRSRCYGEPSMLSARFESPLNWSPLIAVAVLLRSACRDVLPSRDGLRIAWTRQSGPGASP